jgi:hypothetical protein
VGKHGNRGFRRKDGCYRAQFSAAEKGGKGMALKIFTGTKPFPKADREPFGIPEIEMLLAYGRALTFDRYFYMS